MRNTKESTKKNTKNWDIGTVERIFYDYLNKMINISENIDYSSISCSCFETQSLDSSLKVNPVS
jgi:hypothetical protein